MVQGLHIKYLEDTYLVLAWKPLENADSYRIYWADQNSERMQYQCIGTVRETEFVVQKSTHVPHFFKVSEVRNGVEGECTPAVRSDRKRVLHEQRERLNRGLIVVPVEKGVFLSWRLMIQEVKGANATGVTGTCFRIYRNGSLIAKVDDSTNYLDVEGHIQDVYELASVTDGKESVRRDLAMRWEQNYLEIPVKTPGGGVTKAGQSYTYQINDMSVGDVDGDGEFEYIIKWDPTNAHDVSHRGYTGNCLIDCYKLSGKLLWRLDMGCNIRAGAHYTQFMVYDFDGDGKAEMCVKTAPGTKMTIYDDDGNSSEKFITLLKADVEKGVTHHDDYVCSASDYREHMIKVFQTWQEHPMVLKGQWPDTLEECFGIQKRYEYPLNYKDASDLTDYFLQIYAPSRSSKNQLDEFEGFIYEGPEYLTMFGGGGEELETIPFPYPRVDDGLLWGDYAMRNIEPCNRVDRFLSGVAYLDGEHPSVIICRGYYTRATIAAYRFRNRKFIKEFAVDSGFVPMKNPFHADPHQGAGTDPIYGILAGQGNHSLSTADVDGDGCQEIIYGGAVIDHDGSLLYSSYGVLPDGTYAKFGHGDAMHVAKIDPDRAGLQIFNVYEGATAVPYGYALRDAQSGRVIFGEPGDRDLGRCMIGDVNPQVRGLQVWVNDMRSCKGELLDQPLLGTNFSIRWAEDLSTQIIDGADIFDVHSGVIQDETHGIMLIPDGCTTNNGTKGNPCLVADLFGDYREELILRTKDNKAVRIYTNTEISHHKLFTLMHDIQYRTAVAWQNNCYNQPGYTKFYYASDMDFHEVINTISNGTNEGLEERKGL